MGIQFVRISGNEDIRSSTFIHNGMRRFAIWRVDYGVSYAGGESASLREFKRSGYRVIRVDGFGELDGASA